ncbi:MAG TPA: tetratricopeptide repeat protein [Oculatellaceae cyanobacterium]
MRQFNWTSGSSKNHSEQEWYTQMDAGNLAFERGFFLAAIRNYRKAMNIAQESDGSDKFRSCTSLKIAKCYLKVGLLNEAESYFKDVLFIDNNSIHTHGEELAIDMSEMAMLYLKMGRLPAAEDLLIRSVQILEHLSPQSKPFLAKALKNLGIVYCQSGQLCEAETCLSRAICMCSGFKNEERLYAMILAAMASLALANGQLAHATELVQESIQKLEVATGGEHPDLAKILELGATVMARQGLYDEGQSFKLRADSIRKHVRNLDS